MKINEITAQINSLADKAGVSPGTIENAWNSIKAGLIKSGMKENDPYFYGTLVNTIKKKFNIEESLSRQILNLFEDDFDIDEALKRKGGPGAKPKRIPSKYKGMSGGEIRLRKMRDEVSDKMKTLKDRGMGDSEEYDKLSNEWHRIVAQIVVS